MMFWFWFLFFFGFLRKIAFDKQPYHKLLLIKKTVILLDAARENHLAMPQINKIYGRKIYEF